MCRTRWCAQFGTKPRFARSKSRKSAKNSALFARDGVFRELRVRVAFKTNFDAMVGFLAKNSIRYIYILRSHVISIKDLDS